MRSWKKAYRKTNERVAIVAHEAHHGVDMGDRARAVEDELRRDKEFTIDNEKPNAELTQQKS